MSADVTELKMLGERIARVRLTYGEDVNLLDLAPNLFAVLLGASGSIYESYELGEREPSVDFLIALRKKTGIGLDWLLDPSQPGRGRQSV